LKYLVGHTFSKFGVHMIILAYLIFQYLQVYLPTPPHLGEVIMKRHFVLNFLTHYQSKNKFHKPVDQKKLYDFTM
jgi:hypothetical protein